MGKLRDFVPGLAQGFRVYPEDLAGLIGLPSVGNIWYVDATNGSDSSGGRTREDAFLTVSQGLSSATANQDDVVLITHNGGTGRTSETSALTWNKRYTHLVGATGPTAQDARAGISFGTGGSLVISENGCIFKNITFDGTTDINEPVSVTGDYNSFLGVDFKGSLNATTGDDTAMRCLNLDGGQENYFVNCALGADTIMRSAANATVEFENAASRNVFEDCRFIMAADATTPVHVLFTGTSAIDRWAEFKSCSWYSFWTNDADKITAVMDLSAQTATGHVLMTGSNVMVGADDWEATNSGRIYFQGYTNTANVIGIGINPSVS